MQTLSIVIGVMSYVRTCITSLLTITTAYIEATQPCHAPSLPRPLSPSFQSRRGWVYFCYINVLGPTKNAKKKPKTFRVVQARIPQSMFFSSH